jgi:hypothetical protein
MLSHRGLKQELIEELASKMPQIEEKNETNQNSSTITLSDKNQINNLIISPVVNYGYHQNVYNWGWTRSDRKQEVLK